MGCDIHPHIEVKIAGQWYHYSCPRIQRFYALFERICGVRGELDNAISPPRGFPEDASFLTKVIYNYEQPDAHDTTWLSREELCDLIKWHEDKMNEHIPGTGYKAQYEQWGYLTGNRFGKTETGHPKEIEDVRLICWFDN